MDLIIISDEYCNIESTRSAKTINEREKHQESEGTKTRAAEIAKSGRNSKSGKSGRSGKRVARAATNS